MRRDMALWVERAKDGEGTTRRHDEEDEVLEHRLEPLILVMQRMGTVETVDAFLNVLPDACGRTHSPSLAVLQSVDECTRPTVDRRKDFG